MLAEKLEQSFALPLARDEIGDGQPERGGDTRERADRRDDETALELGDVTAAEARPRRELTERNASGLTQRADSLSDPRRDPFG